MSVSISKSASDSVAAVLRGDTAVDPNCVAARKAVKRVERHTERVSEDGVRRVYTITTIAGGQAYGGTRTVSICDEFAVAEEIVLGNYGDIWEHSYHFAVIEELAVNSLYGGFERAQYWYAWQGDRTGGYVPIEKPEQFADVGQFGVG